MDRIDGLDAVVLEDGPLRAAFVPGAGMVGASLRHEGEELLGQRAGLAAYRERGKTMGIPLLHPWANRLARDDYEAAGRRVTLPPEAPRLRREENGLPIHGLLAAHPGWRLRDLDATRVQATFHFTEPDLLALFPFPHELVVTATLDPSALTVDTALRPTGDTPVPVAFGWHPYLTLPGVPRAEWRIELPARRLLAADDRGIPTGDAEPADPEELVLGDRTFDDGLDGLARGATFAVSGGARRLTVTFVTGYPAGQLFAPPGQDLICFEPMAAPTNALRSGAGLRLAQPGETVRATFAIGVEAV